ncbi:translation initiation factor IF-3 [Aquisalimonas lutea]|uniref:translation initiation factor IF-3 n=1 Tax=Aquisalimonas lutea TaxID=1327750 RepID=UPI0025B5CF41|nr:translation initiation factor IF-3 [Aquisalimonas lutea]MDN3519612.1 translation initiation factor IF-3 [Aquisalimonas lutea]
MKNKRKRTGSADDKNVNDQIQTQQVRLIDQEGEQVGIVSLEDALQRAEDAGLDLVEMVPHPETAVCRIMDYGKHKFEASKKQQAAKKKQKQVQLKEVKFRPGTDEGDYSVKVRNLRRFLEEGDRGKVTLRFRGREMAHQDLGLKLLERVEADLEDIAVVEQRPKMEGRTMVMMLAPRKKS